MQSQEDDSRLLIAILLSCSRVSSTGVYSDSVAFTVAMLNCGYTRDADLIS
jgi:hypothetical protein